MVRGGGGVALSQGLSCTKKSAFGARQCGFIDGVSSRPLQNWRYRGSDTILWHTSLMYYFVVVIVVVVVVVVLVSTLNAPKGSNDLREHYLGLLYPSEKYKVYPF